MSRRFLFLSALLGLVTTFGWTSSASATVMVEVPLEEMAQKADGIVFGIVRNVGTQHVVENGGFEIHTISTIEVIRWIGGEVEQTTVTIREYGGESQDRGMWAEGTPVYRPGDLVVVFLERHPQHPDHYRTYAMSQGRFAVMPGAPGTPSSVSRDLDGIAFASWANDGAMQLAPAHAGPAMHFETFVDFVAAARLAASGASR